MGGGIQSSYGVRRGTSLVCGFSVAKGVSLYPAVVERLKMFSE